MKRGFKKEANDYAREFRQDLNLELHDPLCPRKLAKYLCIPIRSISELKHKIANEHIDYLTKQNKKAFSAVTIFHGTKRLIIHNDAHHPRRQASNIAHELSHAILQHQPIQQLNEYGCRNFQKEMEEEANWLGPALLVSEEAALHIVTEKLSRADAAQYYGVSEDVIKMRVNVTGAKKRIARKSR